MPISRVPVPVTFGPLSDPAGTNPTGNRAEDAVKAATSEPLTLSLSEAAKVLGIGVSTAYRLCSRGEFPVSVLRIGGTVKVSTRRLMAYIDGVIDAVESGRS